MSDDDIEKAVKEAAEFEAQDKKRKEAIDTRNDADAFVFQTEKALEEVGDKIDANDKAEVEADLNALKEAINRAPVDQMTDAQVEDIKSGKEKLMNSAQKLFAKVYEQAQAAKIPPKIRVYSFVMLVCFMLIYIVVILMQILTSMGGLFG